MSVTTSPVMLMKKISPGGGDGDGGGDDDANGKGENFIKKKKKN